MRTNYEEWHLIFGGSYPVAVTEKHETNMWFLHGISQYCYAVFVIKMSLIFFRFNVDDSWHPFFITQNLSSDASGHMLKYSAVLSICTLWFPMVLVRLKKCAVYCIME